MLRSHTGHAEWIGYSHADAATPSYESRAAIDAPAGYHLRHVRLITVTLVSRPVCFTTTLAY